VSDRLASPTRRRIYRSDKRVSDTGHTTWAIYFPAQSFLFSPLSIWFLCSCSPSTVPRHKRSTSAVALESPHSAFRSKVRIKGELVPRVAADDRGNCRSLFNDVTTTGLRACETQSRRNRSVLSDSAGICRMDRLADFPPCPQCLPNTLIICWCGLI
jgi:hypothetical protein